jgi:hypothetical protein
MRTGSLRMAGLRIGWHARVIWDRMSPSMLLLLALVLLWGGLRWQVIRPLQHQVAAGEQTLLEGRQVSLPARAVSAADIDVKASHTASASVPARFLTFLPALPERDKQLQRLYSQLRRQALTVGRMEFRQEPVAGLQAERLTVRFSLQGDYPALRTGVRELLNQHPNLAIRRLGLEKPEATPGRLTLTLEAAAYYRTTEPGTSL